MSQKYWGDMEAGVFGIIIFAAYLFLIFRFNKRFENEQKRSYETSLQLAANELFNATLLGGNSALDACYKKLLDRYPREMLNEALDLAAKQAVEDKEKWDILIKDLERDEHSS